MLQVITDFIKSEPSSDSETSADSDHETVGIKQEEACALQTFPTKITESEVSHVCQWHTGGGGFGVQTLPTEMLKALQNHAELNLIVKTVQNC
jgi:fatty acid-binding protein DegV